MLYKMLGILVWNGAKVVLRRKYGPTYVPELLLLDLAHRVARQFVEEPHLARALVAPSSPATWSISAFSSGLSSSGTTQAMIFSPRSGTSSR